MAYDKVVDSAQLDGALSATADAIRGKTGESAPIQWDTGKGFAAAIAAIPAGGGDSSGIGVESGEYIPAADVNTFEVEVPQAVHDGCMVLMCFADAEDIAALTDLTNTMRAVVAPVAPEYQLADKLNYHTYASLYSNSLTGTFGVAANASGNIHTSGVSIEGSSIKFGGGTGVARWRAGVRYTWTILYTEGASA